MAINSFLNTEKEGVNLYEKMQKNRGGSAYKNPWQVFQELITSFNNKGADSNSPLLVNKDLHIVDGAHRLACALYFNEPFITIKINKKLDFSPYGINWFKSNNFSTKELDLILQKKKQIFINGKFELRTMLPLSLSYDHRIIDGAEAARFNNDLKENLGKNFAYKLAI